MFGEADRVLKSLNKAVAADLNVSETHVATQFWHRIGVGLLRGACRSFHWRLTGRAIGDTGMCVYAPIWASAVLGRRR